MTARNGPGNDDRRLHEGERRIGERLAGLTKDDTAARQNRAAQTVNVWCHGYLVVGTRGRCRLVMVVPSCIYCGRPHQHSAKIDFISGKRTASCHGGRYVVHLGTVEGEVAA